MRTRYSLLVGVLALSLLGTVGTEEVSANGCTGGEICYWGEDAYTGCHYETLADDDYLGERWHNCGTAVVNQGTNSFKNRGLYCSIVMYDWSNYNGGHKWAQREGLGGFWFDSNLGNNTWSGSVGGSSGTIMENDITSHDFCA